MKLKIISGILILIVSVSGCTSNMTNQKVDLIRAGAIEQEKGAGFVPIEPIIAKSEVEVVRNGEIVKVDIRLLTNEEALNYFADTWSKVTIAKVNSNGSLQYLAGTATAETGKYAAIMDFTKYAIDDIVENGKEIGRFRTGVGLRLIANITTKKKSIDLNGVLKIGVAASKEELTGSLEVRAIGVTSNEIDALLPGILPTIGESSIQNALEAMAAVKAKLRESDTVIKPRHFAIEVYESVQQSEAKAVSL
ncbi:hypothetical protein GCM10022421_30970 [Oceanisphaera sediminis]|uniref:Uncharacterized protein n=1 Tax=Oceanisphaera sediminis TaxID=981381 RepID=A0ABP7ELW2_9GAMM